MRVPLYLILSLCVFPPLAAFFIMFSAASFVCISRLSHTLNTEKVTSLLEAEREQHSWEINGLGLQLHTLLLQDNILCLI